MTITCKFTSDGKHVNYDYHLDLKQLTKDFYDYLAKYHAQLVKDNSIYVLHRATTEMNALTGDSDDYFYGIPGKYCVPSPDQQKEVLDKRINELLQDETARNCSCQ